VSNETRRFTFTAEVEDEDADPVRFRYLLDESAEVVVLRDWWERMGRPTSVAVTVEPETRG